MLDGMRRQVDLQGGGVRVGPVAVGTLVGLVLVVLALVRLWGAQEGIRGQEATPGPAPSTCCLFRKAAGHLVGRRQVATHLEIRKLSESLFAARMRALVGSVSCVDSAMGSQ